MSERCKCGRVELDSFIGTYCFHDSDHTRELCTSRPEGVVLAGDPPVTWAEYERAIQALRRAERLMHAANDALESDADLDQRRTAFEGIQDYFDIEVLGGCGEVLSTPLAQGVKEPRP